MPKRSIFDEIKGTLSVFNQKHDQKMLQYSNSYASYMPGVRMTGRYGNERTVINAIQNKIAIDVSDLRFNHVIVDDENRYLETIYDELNECLNTEANIDQTSKAFIRDIVVSMLGEGVVSIVPTEFELGIGGSYKHIYSMRTGKITEWFPRSVKVELYDDREGKRKEIILEKSMIAIVENPFYSVMNERNSTMQRLIRKLSLMDAVDEETASGKLNMIIQLPYSVKNDIRQKQAEERATMLEEQLRTSKYGVGYIDSTEHITQLNRPLENNLLGQIEYLTKMVYTQLGLTEEIINGSADERSMKNYISKIVEPIASAIVDEMRRKFLTKTARTQGHNIAYYVDAFECVPAADIAELADKLTRNEILTSNEFRQILGYKPSDDPRADQLRNSNLNHPEDTQLMDEEGSYYDGDQSNYPEDESQLDDYQEYDQNPYEEYTNEGEV